MKTKILVLILILQMFTLFHVKASDIIDIDKVEADSVLEEWNNPGVYSPLNVFDGNNKSCYAEGDSRHSIIFYILLKQDVQFDEIRIAGGLFFNETYFKENNRIKKLDVTLYSLKNGKNPFAGKSNIIFDKEFILKDEMVYQSIKLNDVYKAKYISFYVSEVYKGEKFNDTCISEIEFFYKGQKLNVADIESKKKMYLECINDDLLDSFNDKKYEASDKLGAVTFYRNGSLSYETTKHNFYNSNGIRELKKFDSFMEIKSWKVENRKLYFLYKNKWELVKYRIQKINNRRTVIIFNVGSIRFDMGFVQN